MATLPTPYRSTLPRPGSNLEEPRPALETMAFGEPEPEPEP
jgi:hypothetical protein